MKEPDNKDYRVLSLNELCYGFYGCRIKKWSNDLARICLCILYVLFVATNVCAQVKSTNLGSGYEFTRNGKVAGKEFDKLYVKQTPQVTSIELSQETIIAADLNIKFLSRIPDGKLLKVGNLQISGKNLKKTGNIIQQFAKSRQNEILKQLSFYQIKGEDNRGNVHFTGYFTPVLEARKLPDNEYKFPIYSLPKSKKKYSRKAIDHQNALAGQGLEIAYTNSLLDNYFLSVQGSGVLDFKNGERRQIGYAGQNRLPYRSIGKLLVSTGAISAEKISLRAIRQWFTAHPEKMIPMLNKNPSYTFFKWRNKKITGAAGVALTPMHSVAVDKSCIPYGACLIAEVPILDANGVFIKHNWQILFAHDTGGAIRGPGHLDLYHGFGKKAGDQAGDLHHYGRVWLLLAK